MYPEKVGFMFCGGRTSRLAADWCCRGVLCCIHSDLSISQDVTAFFFNWVKWTVRHIFVSECFLMCRAGVFPLLQPSEYVLEVFKKVKSR